MPLLTDEEAENRPSEADIVRRAREKIALLKSAPQVSQSFQDRVASELDVESSTGDPKPIDRP